MISLYSKIKLIALITLFCVALFFTVEGIVAPNQWVSPVINAYALLITWGIIILFWILDLTFFRKKQ